MRDSPLVAAVTTIAPTATLSAYPEINHPAAASDTARLRLTCGSRPAITNSVRPIPKLPRVSAMSPTGIRRPPFA
ncbi:hypothetical protein [Nonomuraea sp. NPDC049784]|uniref:hypothetical protein n=1 Tax=Nonomuraea sp. NPDC049784 TaxID=3154361 RepID=UPI0033CCC619